MSWRRAARPFCQLQGCSHLMWRRAQGRALSDNLKCSDSLVMGLVEVSMMCWLETGNTWFTRIYVEYSRKYTMTQTTCWASSVLRWDFPINSISGITDVHIHVPTVKNSPHTVHGLSLAYCSLAVLDAFKSVTCPRGRSPKTCTILGALVHYLTIMITSVLL